MDLREESHSTPVGVTEDDTQWKALHYTTQDRKHVNMLLDYSEASLSKEFSYQLHVQSGWEEAVQGWSSCAPMLGLLQLQKKCKKTRAGDNDYHCLLCIDTKPSQNAEPGFATGYESSEANCSLAGKHEDKGFVVPTKNQQKPPPSAICSAHTELHGHKARGKATNRAEFGDKRTNAFQQPLSSLAINVSEKCPLDKGTEVMEDSIAFPTAKGPNFPWSTVELTRRSVGLRSLSTTDSLMAESGSYGIPATVEECDEGEEPTSASHIDTKDNYGHLTPKYRPSHSSKIPLSAFSIGVSKSYGTWSEALPHETSSLGKKVKCDNQNRMPTKSHQGHRTRQNEPSLPVLLGTRVPILSASHRILYLNG